MKNPTISTEGENTAMNASHDSQPQLSDSAFYLIALATLLKRGIFSATMQDYLEPGKFAGFKNDLTIN